MTFDSDAYNRRYYSENKEEIARQKRGYYLRNREREIARVAGYREKNLEKVREYDRVRGESTARRRYSKDRSLKQNYGLTLVEVEAMRVEQGNKCMICGGEFGADRRKPDTCDVDHCHKTGKARDLLCSRCNIGLGHFNDSVQMLRKAARYLARHKTYE